MFRQERFVPAHKVFFTALFVICCCGVCARSPCPLELLTLDFPSAKATVAYGINANGDVVGTYVLSTRMAQAPTMDFCALPANTCP